MSDVLERRCTGHGPWNPGIESTIPDELRPLSTLHRPENVFTTVAEARELRSFTGLDWADVVVFRPSRLALHELLIRVNGDLSVPEGERVEDLGINFREMVRRLLARLAPRMADIDAVYERQRAGIEKETAAQLARIEREPATGALRRVVDAIPVKHGRLWGPRDVIARVAAGIACNDRASEAIGRLLDEWLPHAAAAEGYRLLPAQREPIVMNTKGPSASGKTTIRPLQRELAGRIGADWAEFALISPDIWRKRLLDYGSLGAHHKYAGPFTGEELRIVDQKLDLYMARKAEAGRMPHLLIDRFRFDSFAPHSDEAGSNLLTRFGRVIYMFFMVTPPASLVERAWNRGVEVGRYKAVDDTLAHAVEAYSGMPELFFTWVRRADKRVHFEFLDNDVPPGERPLTAAFGWNDSLTILDPKLLIDVERYRHVNVDARSPAELFRDPAKLADGVNERFLAECLRRFERIDFADRGTGRIHRRIERGASRVVDAMVDPAEGGHTVGRWGPAAA